MLFTWTIIYREKTDSQVDELKKSDLSNFLMLFFMGRTNRLPYFVMKHFISPHFTRISMENPHFHLKINFTGGAVLLVPFDTNWRSSICSFQKQVEQFYLFRRTFDGAVLSVPEQIRWNSSICSDAH